MSVKTRNLEKCLKEEEIVGHSNIKDNSNLGDTKNPYGNLTTKELENREKCCKTLGHDMATAFMKPQQ